MYIYKSIGYIHNAQIIIKMKNIFQGLTKLNKKHKNYLFDFMKYVTFSRRFCANKNI